MSRVAVLVDVEHGHFLPTFEVARQAQAHGHTIAYFAPPDVVQLIRKEGFDTLEVLTSELPYGSARELRLQASGDSELMLKLASERVLPALANGTGLGPGIEKFRPDLLFMSSLYHVEVLAVHLFHAVPMALITTNVRLHARSEACRIDLSRLFDMVSGTEEIVDLVRAKLPHVHTLDQLVDVVATLPDLVLLPKALELPDTKEDANTRYFGSSVTANRSETAIDLSALDIAAPLIYCSLGSQSHLLPLPARKRFFEVVLSAAACLPSCQVVVSVGPQTDIATFRSVPSNVFLFQWAPQLAILKKAALMITHAGMGTMKECVVSGVPMLAFPLGRDHFACAARIRFHGLGLVGDVNSVEPCDLVDMIDQSLSDANLRARVERMRQAVLQEDIKTAEFDFVSDLLRGTQRRVPLG